MLPYMDRWLMEKVVRFYIFLSFVVLIVKEIFNFTITFSIKWNYNKESHIKFHLLATLVATLDFLTLKLMSLACTYHK